jgi:hypothetical protein
MKAEPVIAYLALVLAVVGARLWLISKYGSSVPIHDQWEGEARTLFKPFLEGTLRFTDLFAAHNENRIFPSRLLALSLLCLNQQWDSLVEMIVNAGICGLIAVFVFAILTHAFSGRHRLFLLTATGLWLAVPYGQENTLWGFQSCFYFLILFSCIAIWGIGFHDSFAVKWWTGVICLGVACVSMASGFFAALILLGLVGVRLVKRTASLSESAPTVLILVVLIAVSLYFRISVAAHEVLKATSPVAFVRFLGECLSWPFCNTPFPSVAIYLPLVSLVFLNLSGLQSRRSPVVAIELLGCISGWTILQAAAMAYTRAGDGSLGVPGRYTDVLALGTLCNVCALLVLVEEVRAERGRLYAFVSAGTIWIGVLLFGATVASQRALQGTIYRQQYLKDCEQTIRSYVITKNSDHLLKSTKSFPPYPRLADFFLPTLSDPTIESILPATIAMPIRVEKREDINNAFVENGVPQQLRVPIPDRSWGSFSEQGAEATGAMRSTTVNPRLPFLRFEVAGQVTKSMSFTLEGKERTFANIHVPNRLNGGWGVTYSAVPHEPVQIVAIDEDSKQWFAYREPTELGRYSFYSLQLLGQKRRIFWLGIGLWLILITRRTYSLLVGQEFAKTAWMVETPACRDTKGAIKAST